MKKGWHLFAAFAIFLFLLVGTVSAFNESSTEQERIDAAYACLENNIDQRTCNLLGTEEKIFSLLSTGKCQSELLSDSRANECWPSSNCNIKSTAQAILALDGVDSDTQLAEDWLENQKIIPRDLVWYLEIDSNEATTCTVAYGGTEYLLEIAENKLISGSPGPCLSLATGDYWLEISPNSNCYEEEFEVGCDQNFLTTLLFRKGTSPTVHVENTVNTASADGKTVEQIDSFCFTRGANCNYEGSLWATFVLGSMGYDISSYMPYLVTSYSDNRNYFPEPFLYMLTGESEYRTTLLNMQIINQYWRALGNQYYDTALALLPFQSRGDPSEKDFTKEWLFEIQQDDGCWDGGNVNNNAFLLYSIWPKILADESVPSCVESGYFCTTSGSCDGDLLPSYNCVGASICCDEDGGVEQTCSELSGTICSAEEYCERGTERSSSDTGSYESCCIGGTCEERLEDDGCESSGYFCMYAIDCEGSLLSTYNCAGTSSCCSQELEEKSCSDLSGEICSSDQFCDGGNDIDTSEIFWGETCCVGGTCEEKTSGDIDVDDYTCEINSGICEDFSCSSSDYYESTYYTCEADSVCCILDSPEPEPTGKSYWWLWVLFILIILVVIAIIYRDKLREMLHRDNDKNKKPDSKFGRRPGRMPPGMPIQRKIIRRPASPPVSQNKPGQRPTIQRSPGQRVPGQRIPGQRPPMQRKPKPKTPAELDNVLKKLKDMSK